MLARRSPQAAPWISFQGIEPASPFGRLLGSSVSPLATFCGAREAARAPERWLATVRGSSLQWWEAQPFASASTPDGRPPDIAVDFFGSDPLEMSPPRLWRVVDDTGEPILNPFCFLERCCRAPFVASIFLVERGPADLGWTVIGEAHISNCHQYQALLHRVAQVVAHLIACALRKNGYGTIKRWNVSPRLPSRFGAQVAAGQLRVRVSRAAMTIRREALGERWAIGVLDAPLDGLRHSQFLRADSWIVSSSHDAYLADPFPWHGRVGVFLCERYDYGTHLGRLRLVKLNVGTASSEQSFDLPLGNAHVSYPCTYQERGRTFLLPEMAACGELILFELVSESEARVVTVVNRGTQIADPTLFAHDGLYWIAYSDLAFGINDNLCLLHSKRLEGPWTPHRLNPVKIDVRSSRPGGVPFVLSGKMYRPAQDCSTTYGGALVINRVRVCTPDYYEEEPVAVLKPDRRGPFPHGLHTLSADGSRILFDGKRSFLDLRRLSQWLRARFRRRSRAR